MAEYTGEVIYEKPQARAKPAVNPALVNALVPPVSTPVSPMGVTPNISLSPQDQRSFNLTQKNRLAAEELKKQEPPGATFMDKAKKLKDFEGYLTDYKNELNKDLMVFPKEIPILPSQGLSIPLPVGSDTARMNSKYTALLMGLKDAYELGALTGPDMSIVESQITNPATIAGALTSRDAMQEQVKVLEGMLQRGKQNLESSYGKKMDFGAPSSGANPANDPLGLRPRRP